MNVETALISEEIRPSDAELVIPSQDLTVARSVRSPVITKLPQESIDKR
jgi:hypothetical protein